MEEELELSTSVEGVSPSEDVSASPTAEVGAVAVPEQEGGAEAEKESTTVWENPDVAVRLNLNANNEALTSTAQSIQSETLGFGQHDEGREPVSAHLRNERETKSREDAEEKLGRMQQAEEDRSERRRAEEERSLAKLERMSLGELQQMHAMLSGSAVQKKIEDRLSKGGMSKEQIKKGKSEMEEYLTLRMKEEKEGKDKLTAEEQKRLQEIKQSQEFKSYSVEATNQKNILENEYAKSYNVEYQNASKLDAESTEKRIEGKVKSSSNGYGDLQECLIKAKPITPIFTASAKLDSTNDIIPHQENKPANIQVAATSRVNEAAIGVSI